MEARGEVSSLGENELGFKQNSVIKSSGHVPFTQGTCPGVDTQGLGQADLGDLGAGAARVVGTIREERIELGVFYLMGRAFPPNSGASSAAPSLPFPSILTLGEQRFVVRQQSFF